ncbi:SH3 domain-containing protein [Mariniluteicoccus flavus]
MKSHAKIALAAAGAIALTGTAVGTAQASVTPETGVVVGTGSDGLNVRSTPASTSATVDNYPEGVRMSLDCSSEGTDVLGETTWFKLVPFDGQDRWVSAKFVKILDRVPEPCAR